MKYLLYIFIIFTLFSNELFADREKDSLALVAFYNALDGPNWKYKFNWLSNKPINEWHGITLNDDGRVSRLELNGNNITGELPKIIGDLTDLSVFSLSFNNIYGQIPKEIGNLTNLDDIFLNSNKLSGALPKEMENLKKLRWLYINYNKLDFYDLSNVDKSFYKGLTAFYYTPQDSIGKEEEIFKKVGESVTIESGDKYTSDNVYKWYKDDKLLENENNQNLTIKYFSQEDEGVYTCRVTNKNFSIQPFTLHRRPITLSVEKSEISLQISYSQYKICEGDTLPLGKNIDIKRNNESVQDVSEYSFSWEILIGDHLGKFETTDEFYTNFFSNLLPNKNDDSLTCKLTVSDKINPDINAALIIKIILLKRPEPEWETIKSFEYNDVATIHIISRKDWVYKFYDSQNAKNETTKISKIGDLEWQTEQLTDDISFWVSAYRSEYQSCISDRKEIKFLITSVGDDFSNHKQQIDIYPNPAGDFINISIDNDAGLLTREVQIIDLLGLVVSKSELIDGNNRIDISNLPRGTYFIKVGDKVEKIVKIN